eukprot:TRINITY_DN35862_c0_g1_i1.p1 TRINITY_DN35862_c0_g1~~TRINITY_DN35862_c0_g1_i1.p1  ORF type:complete len:353 (-),score=58.23 TRINITY_DN35862_c0_g1_i1:1074-2132(-)
MNSATSGEGNGAAKKESKKPKYSRFTQQELPACKPLLTPAVAISTFFLIGIIFIPIGVACLLASNSVVEVGKRYDDACLSGLTQAERAAVLYNQETTPIPACSQIITIDKKMTAPVYVYYQLTNYYQNHRRYVKSRDDSQLRGDTVTDLSSCAPEEYLGGNQSYPILPCGLVAWSYFNDSYTLTLDGTALAVNETNISWKSDRTAKFGSELPQNFNTIAALRGGGVLNSSVGLNADEHLIVWMRTAALPTFRKLWGRIETDIPAGSKLTMDIKNRYNTYPFDGEKHLVLSTTSWLGGKNPFLGVAFITVGGLCFVLALLFLGLHLANPRPLGDTSYLSWNRKAMAAGTAGHN